MRMDITRKQIEKTHREEVIRSFNHRILRVAIGRKATDAELGVSNQQIVNYRTLMVRDIQCEFNNDISEMILSRRSLTEKTLTLRLPSSLQGK